VKDEPAVHFRQSSRGASQGRDFFPLELLRLLGESSPEEWAAILIFLKENQARTLKSLKSRVQWLKSKVQALGSKVDNVGESGGESGCWFRRSGRGWEVVFGGGKAFYLEDTLGARYLDYLLHHPNAPISAFELEVAITPEKGQARALTSIQPGLDGQGRREVGQALETLRAKQAAAQAAGAWEEVKRLEGEMKSLATALKGEGGAADTGERARGNVRKDITLVLKRLRGAGPKEQALVQHLDQALSLGYECLYSQPQGRIWE
jgi:hypothetical protein